MKKIYQIRAAARARQDSLKRQLEKSRADEKAAIEELLTPDQLKRLRELRSGVKASDK